MHAHLLHFANEVLQIAANSAARIGVSHETSVGTNSARNSAESETRKRCLCLCKTLTIGFVETARMENRLPPRPANMCARNSIISAKANTERSPLGRPLPSGFPKPGAPECGCRPRRRARHRPLSGVTRNGTMRVAHEAQGALPAFVPAPSHKHCGVRATTLLPPWPSSDMTRREFEAVGMSQANNKTL